MNELIKINVCLLKQILKEIRLQSSKMSHEFFKLLNFGAKRLFISKSFEYCQSVCLIMYFWCNYIFSQHLCFQLQLLSTWEQNQARQGAPEGSHGWKNTSEMFYGKEPAARESHWAHTSPPRLPKLCQKRPWLNTYSWGWSQCMTTMFCTCLHYTFGN